ncbi:MAG: 2-oxoacid:acceptor oxidoreductase subunit alpha [Pirellulales bacterium]|nr:2-oxoacid:acceptor oxidoreductase subunit alpha [Pirellulales bacterium]
MATKAERLAGKPVQFIEEATVRFCGDSGDGMQLAGTQFTTTSALAGNDVATFPDFPAEIRAPSGTKAGVSGFQIHFSSRDIFTPGDKVDALVAMNAAALASNLADLRGGGIVIANESGFDQKNLEKAGYDTNPLEDGSLDAYRVYPVDMSRLTREAVRDLGLTTKQADRCRNFFAMGLVYWLYDRSLEPTLNHIELQFGRHPEIAQANTRALKAGYHYGETIEAITTQYHVEKANLQAGTYRNIMGNTALALGLIAAAQRSGKRLFLGAYPITPASDILHELSRHKNFGVLTFQAEDEIAALAATIGAAYGGEMAATATSGPGIALMSEALGLAVITELPMLIIDVQRGGPSTGLPTKVEQADLFQAVFGRNGECPIPVLAAKSPSDCFNIAIEAWRIAVNYMTPVLILSDSYIANGSEPWRIPEVDSLPKIAIEHPLPEDQSGPFFPYQRNERLVRPWAIPGTPGLMHRIGSLEKQDIVGSVSYDPANHQFMVETRAKKIAGIVDDIPLQEVDGPEQGKLLVLSWGGVYGECITAVRAARTAGKSVAHCHLRYLNPFPKNLEEILQSYDCILIPELNLGQLRMIIRGTYLCDAVGLNKVQGKPFTIAEIQNKIEELV